MTDDEMIDKILRQTHLLLRLCMIFTVIALLNTVTALVILIF